MGSVAKDTEDIGQVLRLLRLAALDCEIRLHKIHDKYQRLDRILVT